MIEVNRDFKEQETAFVGEGTTVLVSPIVGKDYFIARVPLYKDQAILIFPKFGVVGCGFAKEKDWNTNLPIMRAASRIYNHIKHNRKYSKVTEAMCLEAIKELQRWCRDRDIPWKWEGDERAAEALKELGGG